ncbi:MAG: hypothetical protein HYX95_02955 [Chloroflexi bacterium]|nr:hypothetical protein [Chloroflexota bacterium]
MSEVPKRRVRTPTLLAGIGIGLSAAAALWFILWPYSYEGMVTDPHGQQVRTHASFIAQNGYWALVILLFPVAMSTIGFLIVKNADPSHLVGKIAIWLPAAVLLAFCLLALISIGLYYFPSAALLFWAAALATRKVRGTA